MSAWEYDETQQSWKGKLVISSGEEIEVSFSDNSDDEQPSGDGAPSDAVLPFLSMVSDQEPELRLKVTDVVLDSYNETWADDEEEREEMGEDFHPQMDRETFARHIRLDAIQFYGTDHATLLYNDGNLFLGHSIVANLSPDGSVANVTLFG